MPPASVACRDRSRCGGCGHTCSRRRHHHTYPQAPPHVQSPPLTPRSVDALADESAAPGALSTTVAAGRQFRCCHHLSFLVGGGRRTCAPTGSSLASRRHRKRGWVRPPCQPRARRSPTCRTGGCGCRAVTATPCRRQLSQPQVGDAAATAVPAVATYIYHGRSTQERGGGAQGLVCGGVGVCAVNDADMQKEDSAAHCVTYTWRGATQRGVTLAGRTRHRCDAECTPPWLRQQGRWVGKTS